MGGAWRTISVALKADASGYLGPVAAASAATKKMGDEVDSSTKRSSDSWMSFSKIAKVGAAALVLSVGAFIGASIKAAAEFEQRMSAIQAVSGATGGQMDLLRDKALQLGADTSFSAGEAASAMEELVKAGVPVSGVLNGAADAVVALAAAGEIALPEAASIAANAMNQFSLSAEELPHIADLIAGAANASAIDVSDFGLSMSQAGAVANLVGFSFDDTALAITAMGNAGIKGSDAGTSLKTFLTRLVPASASASEEMQKLGIITEDGSNKFFDASGKAKSLAEISDILGGSLEGMGNQQKIAALQTVFGSDAIRAAAVIAEEGKAGFDGLNETLQNTSAAEVAATRMGNLKGSIEQFTGSVETLLIQVGTQFMPFLTNAADGATDLINALASGGGDGWLGAIFDVAQRLRPAWDDLVATGENVWRMLSTVADAAAPTVEALAKLGAAAIVVGLIGIAQALATVSGFLADQKWLIEGAAAAVGAYAASQAWMSLVVAFDLLTIRAAAAGGAITAAMTGAFFGPLLSSLSLVGAGFLTMGTDAALGFSMVKTGAANALTSTAALSGALVLATVGGVALFNALDKAHAQAKNTISSLKPAEFNESSLKSVNDYANALNDAYIAADRAGGGWKTMGEGLYSAGELMTPAKNKILDSKIAVDDLNQASREANIQAAAMRDTYIQVYEAVNGRKFDAPFGGMVEALSGIDAWIQKLKIDPSTMAPAQIAEAIKRASAAADTGSPMVDTLSSAYGTLADNTSTATDRMKGWSDAVDQLIGVQLSAFDSTTKFEQSVDDLTGKLMENKVAGLDQNTQAGRDNASALSGAAQAALDLATAQANGVGGIRAGNEALATNRDRLIEAGVAAGVSRDQMVTYLDQLGLTPQNLQTLVTLEGAGGAQAQLDGLLDRGGVFSQSNPRTTALVDADGASGSFAFLSHRAEEYGRSNPTTTAGVAGVPEVNTALDSTARDRIAAVIAVAISERGDADLNAVAGRQRVANVVANAITGQAEYGLAGVTDKGRVASIIAQALASGADFDLNTVAGRNRLARIVAQADLGGAPGQLDGAAHGRTAQIGAQANTGQAEYDFNYLARARRMQVYVDYYNTGPGLSPGGLDPRSYGNRWGGLYSFAGGGVTPAHVALGTRYKWAEPETGGEAFVPRFGDRARSMSILSTAASWYDVEVVPKSKTVGFANGGVTAVPMGSSGGAGGGPVTVNVGGPTFNVTGNGDKAFVEMLEAKVLPVIERNPDRVAKILVRRAEAVGR